MIQLDRFLDTLLRGSHRCKPHVGGCVVRVELQRRDKAGLGFREPGAAAGLFPYLELHQAERGVRISQIGIKRERLVQRCLGDIECFIGRERLMIVQEKQDAVGETGVGICIIRIQGNRSLELFARL